MNKVEELLSLIQFRTNKSLEEIAEEIDYSRPSLSRGKKNDSPKLYGKLLDVYGSVTNQSQPIKPPDDYEAVISVLLSRVAELLSYRNGTSSVVELTQMQKDVEQLKKMKS